jgi:hypothetical protein
MTILNTLHVEEPVDETARSKEHFISLLYSGVLKRSGSKEEVAAHQRRLEPTFPAAVSLLRGFVESAENAQIRTITATRPAPSPQSPVDHIVSIGSHCFAAATLKRAGLKKFSGPFDWIFSNLSMVADCIDDDFEAFLDKRFYATIPISDRHDASEDSCDHLLFKDRYQIKSIFNHYNPNNEEQYQYLARCVDRFRALMSSNFRTIMFGVCLKCQDSEAHFDRLCALLDRTPNCAAMVILLEPPSDGLDFKFRVVHATEQHRLFLMQPTSRVGPLRFESSFDDYLVRRVLDSLSYSYASGPPAGI